MRETRSKFVRVQCQKCKNKQIIFDRPVTIVNCLVCNEVLAEPTGGKANVKAQVLEILD